MTRSDTTTLSDLESTTAREDWTLSPSEALDDFYIHAFTGVDAATGEVVDRAREAAAWRDSLAYGEFLKF